MKCERCKYSNGCQYFEDERSDFHSCKLTTKPIDSFDANECENYEFGFKTFMYELFIPFLIIGFSYVALFYIICEIFIY